MKEERYNFKPGQSLHARSNEFPQIGFERSSIKSKGRMAKYGKGSNKIYKSKMAFAMKGGGSRVPLRFLQFFFFKNH